MKRFAALASLASLLVACPGAPPPTPAPSPPLVVEPIAITPPAHAASDAAATAPLPKASASNTCTRDEECVASTFPGCCACCKCGPVRAFTRAAEAERHEACGLKACDECGITAAACAPCKDPAAEGMVAYCQSGECVLVVMSPVRVACKTVDDCWFDDAHKPIARPPNMRGKKITPCKNGGEHAPACENGTCIVRAFKC